MKWFALYSAVFLGACVSLAPKAAPLRVDYVGNKIFRWGTHEGYSLLSEAHDGLPQISSDGTFTQERVKLVISEDDESEKSGSLLPETYSPLAGDGATVDFSKFASNGVVTVTRLHCGLAYVKDLLELRREGLELVGHERVTLAGDADPEDVLSFGQVYFDQDPRVDLNEAKKRFFLAGAHYPQLALQFLRRLEARAEEERNVTLGLEAFNYRERFELLEELPRDEPDEVLVE